MAAEPALLDQAARRAWLVRTLRDLAPDFTGDLTDDTPLAEGGLGLDSLSLIDLLAAVESELGVAMSEDDITDEHFGTVARVLRLIESRLSIEATRLPAT